MNQANHQSPRASFVQNKIKAHRQRSPLRTLAITGVVLLSIIVIGVIVAVVIRNKYRDFNEQRESKLAAQARENMQKITAAILSYSAMDKKLPPPVYFDQAGARHSWRTLILPFTSNDAVYSQINLKQSWDSEEQKDFLTGKEISLFKSDRCDRKYKAGTNVAMVVGPGTVFDMTGMEKPETGVLHWFDFPKQKIGLVIELPDSDIYWAEPRDVTIDEAIEIIKESAFDVCVGFSDGSVKAIDSSTSKSEIRLLFQIKNN